MKNIKMALTSVLLLSLYALTSCNASNDSKAQQASVMYLDNFAHIAKGETKHVSVGLNAKNDSSYNFNVSTDNQKIVTVKKDDDSCKISKNQKCSISVTGVDLGKGKIVLSTSDNSIKSTTQDITVSNFSVKKFMIEGAHSCLINYDNKLY